MGGAKVVAATAAVLLSALACTPTTGEAPTACQWDIGIMGALSGDFAPIAKPAARGANLAVRLANQSGELACTLDVHEEDTLGDPKEAPAAARRLIENNELVGCVCGLFSGETLISGDIFEEANVAMLSTAEVSAVRGEGFDTWFRLVAPADQQGRATGIYIKRVLKPRRVAVVTDNQDYSLDIAGGVREELGGRYDGPMIDLTSEELGPDLAAEAVKRRSPDPDAVFYAGYAEQAWSLRRSLEIRGINVPFISDGGARMEWAPEARRSEARHGYFSCACTDVTERNDPETAAFVDAYRETFGREPTQYAPDAFDGTQIVIGALEELSGSESTAEVRAHVVSYLDGYGPTAGITKTYSWNDEGEIETTIDYVYIWEWRRNRGFELLGSVAELTR